MKTNIKKQKRDRRHVQIRTRISGTATIPRLSVFRSNKFMYAQLIDDESSKTLVAASSIEAKKGAKKVDSAVAVGKEIAQKALAMGIKAIVFDRGGFGYRGRVKALAEGARSGGLKF
jgi:large subunit ribosomal protein L18